MGHTTDANLTVHVHSKSKIHGKILHAFHGVLLFRLNDSDDLRHGIVDDVSYDFDDNTEGSRDGALSLWKRGRQFGSIVALVVVLTLTNICWVYRQMVYHQISTHLFNGQVHTFFRRHAAVCDDLSKDRCRHLCQSQISL